MSIKAPFIMLLMSTALGSFALSAANAQNTNVSASNKASNQNSNIRIERKQRGINAELVDQGDFYYHPDGRKISMLRKKDVYVVESNDNAERAMKGMKSQYGDRVSNVKSHRLGGRSVVKVDNKQATKQRLNQSYDISESMLQSSDSAISGLKPVFSNASGAGDILLSPKLTIKLEDSADPTAALKRLNKVYKLKLDRKLRLSGNVYSMSLKNNLSETQQFALVRRVMTDAMVDWAEPQFVAKPYKTSFEPNDALFDQQWHLRNTGLQGSRCDTDCDANNAWDINIGSNSGTGGNGASPAVTGDGMVIAIIDDGVDIAHVDLDIWTNSGETVNAVDTDSNGYVDDLNGWDFVIDSSSNALLQNATLDGAGTCSAGFDGTAGQDNNPSPQATSDCFDINGDAVENDDHGTAVAGLAAAIGNNGIGVAGTAYKAEILPIRLISSFDTETVASAGFCTRAAEAMEYAGRYADVVSNSWGIDVPCIALETAISNVTSGTVMSGGINVSHRANGSPILFAAGNQASGWVKVSIPVSAGEHAYEWRFLRDGLFDDPLNGNHAWLDDITWPGATSVSVNFESGTLASLGFDQGNPGAGDACIAGCSGFQSGVAAWDIDISPGPLFGGNKAAIVDAANADCRNTYLHILRDEPTAGTISFWVWVDADTSADKFEFLIDGTERLSFGDFPTGMINGTVSYPANLSTTIAVGSSNSGDLSGTSTAGLANERRAFYSQYGPNLDVLAPSSDQALGITTTDRMGADGYDASNYTNTFGGTSASTPIVAGIAAAILAVDTNLTAAQVRDILRNTADQIGDISTYTLAGGEQSLFYGHGRVNMYSALIDAAGITAGAPSNSCTPEPFSFTSASSIFLPESTAFCAAIGEIPQDDGICFPIKAANGNVAVICL